MAWESEVFAITSNGRNDAVAELQGDLVYARDSDKDSVDCVGGMVIIGGVIAYWIIFSVNHWMIVAFDRCG